MTEVNVPNKPTATVTATPKPAASISSSGSVTIVGGDTIKDVSLFAMGGQGWYYDSIYVKAPAGMLKTTDKIIFARYITNKTRPRVNGETDSSQPRKYYRGWIKPAMGEKRNNRLLVEDDEMLLELIGTEVGYDTFEIVHRNAGENLLYSLVEYVRFDDDNYRYPNVINKKLGIKIERNGKTIVDYMRFSIASFHHEGNDYYRFIRL